MTELNEFPFVGRKEELERLEQHLDLCLSGQAQFCFVSGEAGSGKTTLIRHFVEQAQNKNDTLLCSVGGCSGQSGPGEPFQPFQELLSILTGAGQNRSSEGVLSDENEKRLQKFLALSGLMILESAVELAGTLVPAAKLLVLLGTKLGKATGLEERFETVLGRRGEQEGLNLNVAREQIFEHCTELLIKIARSRPLLLILDDLQWIDHSSLNLLHYLSRRIADERICIVGAYRPAEVAAGRSGDRHPLEKALSEFRRTQGEALIPIDGSSEKGLAFVNALLDTQPNRFEDSFRRELYARTGGNALFLTELILDFRSRGLIQRDHAGRWFVAGQPEWDSLPSRVDAILAERVARLGESDQELLTLGSTEGEIFSAEAAAHLLQQEPRTVVRRLSGELSRKQGLVRSLSVDRIGRNRISKYRFTHHLLHDYLYAALDGAERSYLHEEMGYFLEDLYSEEVEAAVVQLAWHFSEAGIEDKALHYLRLAARQASSRFAHDEAFENYTLALELTPESASETRLELLLEREAVSNWQGHRDLQRQDLEAMEELVSAVSDQALVARIAIRRAEYCRQIGEYETGLSVIDRALEILEDESIQQGQAAFLKGRILFRIGEYREAQTWFENARLVAVAEGDELLRAQALYNFGLTEFYLSQFDDARAHFEEAQASFKSLDHIQGEINGLLMLGSLDIQRGHIRKAIETLTTALQRTRSSGWRSGQSYILPNLGAAYLEVGLYDEAEAYYFDAREISQEVEDREGEAICYDALGQIYHRRGELEKAIEAFKKALRLDSEIGYRRGEAYASTHLGYVWLEKEEWGRARAAFQQALTLRRSLYTEASAALDPLAGLAAATLGTGDSDQATHYAVEAFELLERDDLDAAEYPVQSALLCYRVFDATRQKNPDGAEKAQRVLALGLAILERQIDAIDDDMMRTSFLEHVPHNREMSAI